jgi:hypothetical protein
MARTLLPERGIKTKHTLLLLSLASSLQPTKRIGSSFLLLLVPPKRRTCRAKRIIGALPMQKVGTQPHLSIQANGCYISLATAASGSSDKTSNNLVQTKHHWLLHLSPLPLRLLHRQPHHLSQSQNSLTLLSLLAIFSPCAPNSKP